MSKHALESAATTVAGADSLVLMCHVGPDGDALGSMIGLAQAAKNAGKQVVASFGSPFVVPHNMGFLDLSLVVDPREVPNSPEVVVVLDAGSPDRIGDLAAKAAAAESLIVLDHHMTNEGFGDVAVVDPAAAATGEIVFDLLELLDWPLTQPIAMSLFTALVTDTGRFVYSNTTPRTLEIAAVLVAAGAEPSVIGRHVYEEAPFAYLKVTAAALEKANLDGPRSVVSAVLTHEDLDAAGAEWGDVDGLIDVVRLAREADVAILAKAHADGRVKVSMRSRGETDVGRLAADMGGGGHRLAAGFTVEKPPAEVVAELVERVEAYR